MVHVYGLIIEQINAECHMLVYIFSVPLRSKGVLMRPGVRPHECVRARDQNVQFLRFGQFPSNYKG